MSPAMSSGLGGANLRMLHRELASAHDEQIHRVLAIIDDLAERGEADRLIAPLRRRLAELRPRRKMTLTRLLFTPFNPLIVDGGRWNAADPSIPRTAIRPIAGQVRRALGMAAQLVDAAATQLWSSDCLGRMADTSEDLWSSAAQILQNAPMPPDWIADTGLRETDYRELTAVMSALLVQAQPLAGMIARARHGFDPTVDQLLALFEGVAGAGPKAVAMMAAMALQWLPRSDLLMRAIEDFAAQHRDPAIRATVESAVAFVLDRIEESPLPDPDLTAAAGDVRRIAVLLENLALGAAQYPSRRKRIDQVRTTVDDACRERFGREVDTQLLAPAGGIADASDAMVAGLEATARDLRRFENAARKIGGAVHYSGKLQHAAQALSPAANDDQETRVSRIRLVEILCGSDAARAMLG
ncbi:MAG TPA: hypothetical protein VFL55_12165 [Acetobacteraceae bacterium]|nr:hypothetical protein [Acetobacteraceae bacterium]